MIVLWRYSAGQSHVTHTMLRYDVPERRIKETALARSHVHRHDTDPQRWARRVDQAYAAAHRRLEPGLPPIGHGGRGQPGARVERGRYVLT